METILDIPRAADEPLKLDVSPGNVVFVVGPNGSGKSALIQHAVTSIGVRNVKRVAAHRQLSMQTGSINMTAENIRQFRSNLEQWEVTPQYRWMEHNQQQRLSSVLYDLTRKEHSRQRRVTDLVDANNPGDATKLAEGVKSPFKQINDLLNKARLMIEVENVDDEEIVAKRQDVGARYSIAEMSDGERSAVLIAAEVLTVEAGKVLLIDEPERHLHRSIIEPLLSALFDQRPDCAFVVSTHEIELPMAYPDSKVLITRSCTMNGAIPYAWDIQVLEGGSELPDDLKREILGSRKRILFVEGESHKLDQPLYGALFPDISVIAKGTSHDVIGAVKGLRGSANLHHTEAFGLIDKDFRHESEIAKLAEEGIFALDVYSVESLYYCSDATDAVATHQSKYLGLDAESIRNLAITKAMGAINQDSELAGRMAARRAQHMVRNLVQMQLPDWKGVQDAGQNQIMIVVESPYDDELARIKSLVADENLDGIVARYPIHKSKVIAEIVAALQIRREHYERLLPKLVRDDQTLADSLKSRLKGLADTLARGG